MFKMQIFKFAEQVYIETQDRQRVFDAVNGDNLLVEGNIGIGKTTIFNQLIKHLEQQQDCHLIRLHGVALSDYRIYELYHACILSVPKARPPRKLDDMASRAKECLSSYTHLKQIYFVIDNAQDLDVSILKQFKLFQKEVPNLKVILFSSSSKFEPLGFKSLVLEGLSIDEYKIYMETLSKASNGVISNNVVSYESLCDDKGFMNILDMCLKALSKRRVYKRSVIHRDSIFVKVYGGCALYTLLGLTLLKRRRDMQLLKLKRLNILQNKHHLWGFLKQF